MYPGNAGAGNINLAIATVSSGLYARIITALSRFQQLFVYLLIPLLSGTSPRLGALIVAARTGAAALVRDRGGRLFFFSQAFLQSVETQRYQLPQ